MQRERATHPDARIAAFSAAQHGVISRRQLRALGVSDGAIAHRVGAGRLHRVHRGVYAVGHASLSAEGRWSAAVLACGDGAVLSHRSAAALWGLRPSARWAVDVTAPTHAGRAARPGLTVHRSAMLGPQDVTRHHAIPVTTPARTLLDLAAVVRRDALERALVRGEGSPRPPHSARKRRRIGPYEVDFLWRDRRVVVETDGRPYHATAAAFERDRTRDASLVAAGYRVVRFTHRQVTGDPGAVAGVLRALLHG